MGLVELLYCDRKDAAKLLVSGKNEKYSPGIFARVFYHRENKFGKVAVRQKAAYPWARLIKRDKYHTLCQRGIAMDMALTCLAGGRGSNPDSTKDF